MIASTRLDDRKHALFLDFDGTLADIAPRPDDVHLDNTIPPTLTRLQQKLGGALALITGRPMDDIDDLLAPLRLPAAYEHGAVLRMADGEVLRAVAPDLGNIRAVARQLVRQYPALMLEEKSASLALHFRQAPELETVCLKVLTSVMSEHPDLKLLQGKAVMEIKSASVHKGMAIATFMRQNPFRGRIPVFAGDDVTDEAGFLTVQQMGGLGIKVGEGPTVATVRLPDPPAFRQWLTDNAQDEHTA